MDNLYYTIFFIAFPVMCLFSNLVASVFWLFGERKQEAKLLLVSGCIGAIFGYFIALTYFLIARDISTVELFELSTIGLLVGSGYLMLGVGLLPKSLKNKLAKRG